LILKIVQEKKVLGTPGLKKIVATCLAAASMAAAAYSQSPRQTPPPPVADQTGQLSDALEESRSRLLSASQTYRQSLERLLVLQTQDASRARANHDRNLRLLELGLIPRRQIETSEAELKEVLAHQTETARQLESIDHLVAEVHASEQLASLPSVPSGNFSFNGPLLRFVGAARWSMADSTKLDAFYRLKFGKPLPISAFGQTETHQRLGFDHREALDVAVHPDSPEGQELILYLQSQGLSFIAIRAAITGSATGAHIHIGPPSRRSIITK
jgi:Spy/CpxP family protein refolding chaperone